MRQLDGAGWTVELGKSAIPGGVNQVSAKAVELKASRLVEGGQQFLPPSVAQTLGNGCGPHNVSEEQGCKNPFAYIRRLGPTSWSGDVISDQGLLSDNPAVVTGWDIDHITGPDVVGRAVVHDDSHPTGGDQQK